MIKKYWYKFWHSECVLCGWEQTYKARMFTKKPKEYFNRHSFEQTACSRHFI